MKESLKEALILRIGKNHAAYLFLQNIMADSTVYLFGGGVRDYLDNTFATARDLDFVIVSNSKKTLDIKRYIPDSGEIIYTTNRFNGHKITFSRDLVFDIWNLEDTWAFKTNRIEASVENLMNSVYLNIDQLLYSVTADSYLKGCDEQYRLIKNAGKLDIIYEETPYEELNLLRALVYRKKYSMIFTEALKTKFYEHSAKNQTDMVEKLMELQLSHYHSIQIDKSEIIRELNNLKRG